MLVVAIVLWLHGMHLREFEIYMDGGTIEAAKEKIHSIMVEFPLQAEEQCTYSQTVPAESKMSPLHPETVSTSLQCEY